jgi:hypothetical protein
MKHKLQHRIMTEQCHSLSQFLFVSTYINYPPTELSLTSQSKLRHSLVSIKLYFVQHPLTNLNEMFHFYLNFSG